MSNILLVFFSVAVRLPSGGIGVDVSSTGVSLRPVVKMFGVVLTCFLASRHFDIETKILIPWMVSCYLIALVLETTLLVRAVDGEEPRA